ncbi:Histone acetyltransferase ESA1 [Trichinella pseudospiralis]|uniref:histone acetyltransferase n=2 Tax=Trichinella pseudospiralis TaxID=6337 RepID=A0A0V1HCD1_TRIPS|nr:Histone acetyltransferase ESA1 [Trichinella pseudospiralis]
MEFVLPTEARYADEIQPIVHHSNVPHLGYILSKSENGIITLERPFSVEGLAAYRQYWLQSIVEYMAQKGTKRQFDITELPKLSGIADVDIAATLFTYDMLRKSMKNIGYASIFETAAQSLFYVAYGEEKRIGLESYDLPKSLVDPAKTEEEIENSLASIV